MNSVNGISGNATVTADDYMKKSTGLNKDDFMKLFVTQLQYQDPLSPQDSSAMVAQMAQLTQVEQSYNTNKHLQNLLQESSSASGLAAVAFIGKRVTAENPQISLDAGGSAEINFTLDHAADKLRVDIQDANGRTVRTLTAGNTPAGAGQVVWDGRDGSDNGVAAGIYRVVVTGVNRDGSSFGGTPLLSGTVTGMNLTQGAPLLSIGGVEVPLAGVRMVTVGA